MMGEESWGKDLGLERKKKGPKVLEGGRRRWNGSAQRIGFQQKEGACGILAKTTSLPLGQP